MKRPRTEGASDPPADEGELREENDLGVEAEALEIGRRHAAPSANSARVAIGAESRAIIGPNCGLITAPTQRLGDGASGDLCGEVCGNLHFRFVLDRAVDARLHIC